MVTGLDRLGTVGGLHVNWACRKCGKVVTVRASEPDPFGPQQCDLNLSDLTCSDCKAAAKAEFEAEREEKRRQAIEDQKRSHRAFIISSFGPPKRFEHATLDKPRPFQAAAVEVLKPMADYASFNEDAEYTAANGACLIGPVGTGKSFLAAGLWWAYLKFLDDDPFGEEWAWYISEYDLLAHIRETFDSPRPRNGEHRAETEQGFMARLKKVWCLIIDDIAKYTPADASFRNRILFELIDARWANKRQTIITSNLTLAQLAPLIGEPTVDRLRDFGPVIELKGPSQRGKPQTP